MANREFLNLFGRARKGDTIAQLLLGKIFFSGGYGLAPSPDSALLWLSRAAQKNNLEAQFLIGRLFPPALTKQLNNQELVRQCYRVAAEAGVEQAQEWLAQIASSKKLRQVLQTYLLSSEFVAINRAQFLLNHGYPQKKRKTCFSKRAYITTASCKV